MFELNPETIGNISIGIESEYISQIGSISKRNKRFLLKENSTYKIHITNNNDRRIIAEIKVNNKNACFPIIPGYSSACLEKYSVNDHKFQFSKDIEPFKIEIVIYPEKCPICVPFSKSSRSRLVKSKYNSTYESVKDFFADGSNPEPYQNLVFRTSLGDDLPESFLKEMGDEQGYFTYGELGPISSVDYVETEHFVKDYGDANYPAGSKFTLIFQVTK